ncbi:diguanylate cyclase [Capsulimonas corticalis]|uniref:Diguanylate cyclase n=1 Tax=Capsulimonas corticalis TaxID=2219043 RepID=A0A402CSN5_9BACT|nr:ring-cleaving dioxygenase [Capsulimonas corticalis]BDI31022.1 diguanylate cyclase [Capsulimonas corticalis]
MSAPIGGLHHVTAIAGDAQRNFDFYAGQLGLRLVKKTVNFDDPGTYHLYYGDGMGNPGTLLTFFPWKNAPRGRKGSGETEATALSVPAGSLEFWRNRLEPFLTSKETKERFGSPVLSFADPDGLALEIVETSESDDARTGWTGSDIPREFAVRGLYGVTIAVRDPEPTARVLTGLLGFEEIGAEGERRRFVTQPGAPGAVIDLIARPDAPAAQTLVGSVHHIAYRLENEAAQIAWRDKLHDAGLGVTDVREREYFRSIYFHEPGRVLFELATDAPGFATDETPDALGTALKLPPWLETRRASIAGMLPALETTGERN